MPGIIVYSYLKCNWLLISKVYMLLISQVQMIAHIKGIISYLNIKCIWLLISQVQMIAHIKGIIYHLNIKCIWLLLSQVSYITYISSVTDYSYLRCYLLQIAQVEMIICIPGIICDICVSLWGIHKHTYQCTFQLFSHRSN